MNKNYMVSLIAVIVLFLIAYAGTQQGAGLQLVFGIIVPYLAVILFVVGFARRVMGWARSAVPFRITTTGGQLCNSGKEERDIATQFPGHFLQLFPVQGRSDHRVEAKQGLSSIAGSPAESGPDGNDLVKVHTHARQRVCSIHGVVRPDTEVVRRVAGYGSSCSCQHHFSRG